MLVISLLLMMLTLLKMIITLSSTICRNVTEYEHHNHTRKAWCLQDQQCPSRIDCDDQMRLSGSGDAFWDICLDNLYEYDSNGNASCLIYSFGISNDYAFDLTMGRLGCEVHMFDPTTPQYQHEFAKNCYFHPIGIYGGAKNISYSLKFQSKYYGKIDDINKMMRLDEIIEMLGHQNRTISIFKIDCEGCELEVFGHRHPKDNNLNLFSKVNQILVEFHFSSSLGIDNINRIPLIANSYDAIINSDRNNKFIKFYQNDRSGYDEDQIIIPELVELGFAKSSCCREMGFTRRCVSNTNTNNINITEYALEQYRKSLEGSVFGLHSEYGNDKRIYLMENHKKRLFPSGKIFVSHGYDFFDTKMEREVYSNWIESGPDME